MTSQDIQLERDKTTGRLPYLTNWSRQEVAALKITQKGNTDHWAKAKHKNLTFFTSGADDKTHLYPGDRYPHEIPPPPASTGVTPHHQVDGTMKDIGTRSFTALLLGELNGNWPGDYQRKTRRVPACSLRTTANDRAREGYEYWCKEKQPLKKGCKNWIGRGGNVLGTQIK